MGVGCNTPCVEVRDDTTGACLILDGGSGLVGLSDTFAGEPRPTPVLLSHYHWDHTQGLPFYGPLYTPGSTPEIVGPDLTDVPRDWLDTLFDPPNFPVGFAALPNRPTLRLIDAAPLELGGFRIDVQRLTHPGGAFGYRIHGRDGDLCYITDHEFGDAGVDAELEAFCRGCSAVIADAHFTPDELLRHNGWGHGSWDQVAGLAARCGAGRLWLFHHKPGRTDDELTEIVEDARRIFASTDAAREGLAFEI
jgi:phosphoribosyl 1,2-cyclic phosphodiesterase